MQPSMTGVGKTIRMNRIFKDGKAVMVAVNHGISLGPIDGINHLEQLFSKVLVRKPDSLTIHKGIAMRFCDMLPAETSLLLKVTNASLYFSPEEMDIATVHEAALLGADAIAIGLSLCGPGEPDEIQRAARMVQAAEAIGMPTVAHSYPCGSYLKDTERYDIKNVSYAVRVAQELGIDIIKTYWTGSADTFAKAVELGAPAKVVISGGPRCATLRACFEMTKSGMDAGAAGITYGRNIWQHPYHDAVVAGLQEIVHNGATVDQAMEAAETLSGCHLE